MSYKFHFIIPIQLLKGDKYKGPFPALLLTTAKMWKCPYILHKENLRSSLFYITDKMCELSLHALISPKHKTKLH